MTDDISNALSPLNPFTKTLFYFSVFLSGFFILVLEVLGTRLISPYYGSTIFVWSALISVTLAALADRKSVV